MFGKPREVIWDILVKKRVHKWYTDAIKDMYDGVITSLRTIKGETDTSPVTTDSHQGFALSL